MNSTKKIISLLGILAILIALFFVSLSLRDKSRTNLQRNNSGQSNEHGFYTVENKDLGYKFELSDEFFSKYQEEHHGLTTYYKLPTKDIKWNTNGTLYADVFAVTAYSKLEVEKDRKTCETKHGEPFQCEWYDNASGENNFYYFVVSPTQDPPDDFIASGVVGEGLTAGRVMQTFNIQEPPKTFTYENLNKGYSFNYPSYLSSDNNEVVNSLGLPFSTDKIFTPEPGLSWVLPIKYCALSGQCQPNTLNYAIVLGQLDFTEAQLLKTPIAKSLTKLLVGDQTVYEYQEGAEGEGIIYQFVLNESAGPQTSPKVFVVALKYLDETVNHAYDGEANFISFNTQKKIVTNIIKSLEFQTSINKE